MESARAAPSATAENAKLPRAAGAIASWAARPNPAPSRQRWSCWRRQAPEDETATRRTGEAIDDPERIRNDESFHRPGPAGAQPRSTLSHAAPHALARDARRAQHRARRRIARELHRIPRSAR